MPRCGTVDLDDLNIMFLNRVAGFDELRPYRNFRQSVNDGIAAGIVFDSLELYSLRHTLHCVRAKTQNRLLIGQSTANMFKMDDEKGQNRESKSGPIAPDREAIFLLRPSPK
jgi:hypothetical protein